MKILVPVKRVPDPEKPVRLTEAGQIQESRTRWVLNPLDEIALEAAVRWREEGLEVEIVAVTVGGDASEEQLRAALARGADRAILVLDDAPLDPQIVGRCLAVLAGREQPDLVLMGNQASDDDCGQTGQRMAALWDRPQAASACGLAFSADRKTVRVVREVDTGRETVDLALPAVVTVDLHLNQPRLIPLAAILAARGKPVERLAAPELGERRPAGQTVLRWELPPPRPPVRMVQSVDELLAALRDEARAIPTTAGTD